MLHSHKLCKNCRISFAEKWIFSETIPSSSKAPYDYNLAMWDLFGYRRWLCLYLRGRISWRLEDAGGISHIFIMFYKFLFGFLFCTLFRLIILSAVSVSFFYFIQSRFVNIGNERRISDDAALYTQKNFFWQEIETYLPKVQIKFSI